MRKDVHEVTNRAKAVGKRKDSGPDLYLERVNPGKGALSCAMKHFGHRPLTYWFRYRPWLVLAFCCACHEQTTESPGQNPLAQGFTWSFGNRVDLRILLFPSGGKQDVRYTIVVRGDSLAVRNLRPDSQTGTFQSARKLSAAELEQIRALLQQTPATPVRQSHGAEDTWAIRMEVNGAVVYEDENFSLDSAGAPYGGLPHYLLTKTPVRVNLYGFS
jgi:hypothetical protein